MLLFGGSLLPAKPSARQLFHDWVYAKKPRLAELIRTPEDFEDWNAYTGYGNLVDFEIDAGHLSRAIVLFSESEGAFAELGAFCMDPTLAEQLFVVISNDHYEAPSYIANGPIKKIDIDDRQSVCIVQTLDPALVTDHFDAIALALEEKLAAAPSAPVFKKTRRRDQFLLAADLIDLFGAVTARELHELMGYMEVELEYKELEQITNQLCRFELIHLVPGTSKRFFVPHKNRHSYINYVGLNAANPFVRPRFKMLTIQPWLIKETQRLAAYNNIHGKA
ncbi:retron St85 family effector protein [Rhodoferax mekongensis]|uniref:retron St85 family effector protein n=1 Tax=Rhodoferax mekongensis TaxID=3068341 RepID=UPI0028BD8672|nr:retron St85 family effector protein [Rhodoferax sp. TBRC 17199]MDT7516646.1 retron St85 family effector protein [Rhodoferax sp. TBRC 17199]